MKNPVTKAPSAVQSTLDETLELTGDEGAHIAALKTEKEANTCFDALFAYRRRVMKLVFEPAREGKTAREQDAIEALFHKVLREAGEVGAVTYVRLMFTDVQLS